MSANEEQFNRYCAEVEGVTLYSYKLATENFNRFYMEGGSIVYDPYYDMDQLTDVVDYIRKKYLWSCHRVGEYENMIERVNSEWFVVYRSTLIGTPLKDALRKFIWAIMATDKLPSAGNIVIS